MNFPADCITIADKAITKHGDDITAAINLAETQIRKMKEFPELVDSLVRGAVQELVYQRRHVANTAARKAAGAYGQAAKVVTGASEAVQEVARSLYGYYIAGRTLGSVLGSELEEIADSETAVAAGHSFNARLCRKLAQIVPVDKTVREAVSERKLKALFADVGGPVPSKSVAKRKAVQTATVGAN